MSQSRVHARRACVTYVTGGLNAAWHSRVQQFVVPGRAPEDVAMKSAVGNIGVMIATNTALFTALDMGQWIADKFALWTFPANVVAAIIATGLGLALSAAGRAFGVNGAQA
jgi:uncharacterized membrane protein YjjP (DUF1212 family)